MNQFKDFGIKPIVNGFIGDKIKINKILNREITVLEYKIEESKYKEKGNGKCLHMQIAIGEAKHIVFTGSTVLMETLKQVSKEKFPFVTKIVLENERLEFT